MRSCSLRLFAFLLVFAAAAPQSAVAAPPTVTVETLTGSLAPRAAGHLEFTAPAGARKCQISFKSKAAKGVAQRFSVKVTAAKPYVIADWTTGTKSSGPWTARVGCGSTFGASELPIQVSGRRGAAPGSLVRKGSFKSRTSAIPSAVGVVPRASVSTQGAGDEVGIGAAGNPYAGGGCTSWAWQNRQDLPGRLGNARYWAASARAAGFPVDGTPEVGAIAVYQPGVAGAFAPYGHVAVVEKVEGSRVFISEANYNKDNPALGDRTIFRRYTTIVGVEFIHRKGYTGTPSNGSSPSSNAPAPAALPPVTAAPPRPPGALSRYYDAEKEDHWETVGAPGGRYGYESNLGFVLAAPGAGRVALYGCLYEGRDRFLTLDPGCEGKSAATLEGYVMSAAPPGVASAAIYRCSVMRGSGLDHFTSADAACEGRTTESRLGYLLQRPAVLVRYYNADTADHWDTAGPAGTGYVQESTLGSMLDTGAADRTAIYACLFEGRDRFLSTDPACEGKAVQGLEGYLYSSAPAGVSTVALYRCTQNIRGLDHFTSTDPGCEGKTLEHRLGYALRRQAALVRTYDSDAQDHWVTTGIVPASYRTESTLGYLLAEPGEGRTALYGCLYNGYDHFLSVSPTCEGKTVLGLEGFVWTAPPGSGGVALYRCAQTLRHFEHFVSTDPNCEGRQLEMRLGYATIGADF